MHNDADINMKYLLSRLQTRLIIEATKDNTVPLTKDGLREACIAKMQEARDKVCNEVFTTERDFVAGKEGLVLMALRARLS